MQNRNLHKKELRTCIKEEIGTRIKSSNSNKKIRFKITAKFLFDAKSELA